jgi:hypothetical protein
LEAEVTALVPMEVNSRRGKGSWWTEALLEKQVLSLPEFVGLPLYECIFNQRTIEYMIQELFYLDFTFPLSRHLNKVEYIPELLQCTYSVIFFNFYMI